MFASVKKNGNCVRAHQDALEQESSNLENELYDLQSFITAAPALREEARLLVPPPDEFAVNLPDTPNRSDLRRMQRLSYLNGIKLVAMLSVFLAAAIWFINRFVSLGV